MDYVEIKQQLLASFKAITCRPLIATRVGIQPLELEKAPLKISQRFEKVEKISIRLIHEIMTMDRGGAINPCQRARVAHEALPHELQAWSYVGV